MFLNLKKCCFFYCLTLAITLKEASNGNVNVESIKIFGENIKALILDDADEFKKLLKIEFIDTSILEIPDGLEKIENLKTLIFKRNDISKNFIPLENLGKLKTLEKLTSLQISGYGMVKIPTAIVDLKNLTELILDNNSIFEIDRDILKMKSLELLNLSNNKFFEFPRILFEIESLLKINFHNNRIKVTADNIEENNNNNIEVNIEENNINIETNIRENNNYIENSSKRFQSKITDCDFSKNFFEIIPAEIFEMKELTELNFSANKIEIIPKEIKNFSKLEYLDLSSNKIKSLPNEFLALTKLSFLDLSSNQIEDLEGDFTKFENLQDLILNGNKLKEVPEFGKNLENFEIKNNKLIELPDWLFDCKELFKIEVDNNEIETISPKIENLSKLSEFYIPNNKISFIPEEFFKLKKLKQLDFKNNKISVISKRFAEFSSLKHLLLEHNRIKEIYDSIFYISSLEHLNLSFCGISVFLEDDVQKKLGRKSNLLLIDLDKNFLTSIPDCVVASEKLTNLKLSANKIEIISDDKFKKLKNLCILDLTENKLTKMCSLKNNLKLTELYLSSNNFEIFPKEICECTSLTKLVIQKNKIKNIPGSIQNLKNLEFLFLDFNNLRKLGTSIFKLNKLKQLGINNNNISKIKPEIKNLTSLVFLQGNNNQFEKFPFQILSIPNLETVFLKENKMKNSNQNLKKIKDYGKKSKIKEIYLKNNNLDEIPKEICNLKNLQILVLSKNNIKTFDSELEKLVSLRELFLKNNKLENFPNLEKNLNLEKIDLGKNLFSDFPIEILNNKVLKILGLRKNKIKTIPPEISKLKSLHWLDLSYNKVSVLPDALFDLKSLKTIHITNNQIKEIPDSVSNNPNLNGIYINANLIEKVSPKVLELYKKGNFTINLMANFIPLPEALKKNEKKNIGEEEIENENILDQIKKYQKDDLFPQYKKPITLEKAIKNHKKENLHWNISKLKKIKTDDEIVIEKASKISNEMIFEMWDRVLKYFIQDKMENQNEMEENEKIEDEVVGGAMPDDKIIFSLIKDIESQSILKIPANGEELREKGNQYFKQLSESVLDTENNKKLMAYAKLTFYKALIQINRGEKDQIELLKANLFAFGTFSMKKCFNGQIEGFKNFYNVFSTNEFNQLFEKFVEEQIANLKEKTFMDVVCIDHSQNVHYIGIFRNHFQKILGIAGDVEDPYDFYFFKDCTAKEGNVLEDFFKKFKVETVVNTILETIDNSNYYKDLAFAYLKKSNPEFTADQVSINFFELFKDEEDDDDKTPKPIFREKLKKDVFLQILLDLKLIEQRELRKKNKNIR